MKVIKRAKDKFDAVIFLDNCKLEYRFNFIVNFGFLEVEIAKKIRNYDILFAIILKLIPYFGYVGLHQRRESAFILKDAFLSKPDFWLIFHSLTESNCFRSSEMLSHGVCRKLRFDN